MMTSKQGQSWVDIAVMATGIAANAEAIAKANDADVTDMPECGSDILMPQGMEIDDTVRGYYTTRGLQPATALLPRNDEPTAGIGAMGIDINFIVG
ncbi:MAG: hypothetical protein RRY55_01335 [Bacteroidales bacterium]